MDSIIACGRVMKSENGFFYCDLNGPGGRIQDFPVSRQAFQEPPSVGSEVAFMTWKTPGTPGFVQVHQSACAISSERYVELASMSYNEAKLSMICNEFFARSAVSGPTTA